MLCLSITVNSITTILFPITIAISGISVQRYLMYTWIRLHHNQQKLGFYILTHTTYIITGHFPSKQVGFIRKRETGAFLTKHTVLFGNLPITACHMLINLLLQTEMICLIMAFCFLRSMNRSHALSKGCSIFDDSCLALSSG